MSQPTRAMLNPALVLQRALAAATGTSVPALRHHLSMSVSGGRSPATYPVDLTPNHHGTFLVTCPELPEVFTFGENEEDALALAREAIEATLWARRIRLAAVS